MSTGCFTRRFWQRAGAALVASLLLFSGVANAYCSIGMDSTPSNSRAAPAFSTASTPYAHDGETARACPDLPDPDKQGAKPCAQWDAAPGGSSLRQLAIAPAPRAAIAVARPEPVVEPVFQRFPRLLI